MINFRAPRGFFLVLVTTCFCLCPALVEANGEELASTSSESKPVPADQLGTGNFSKFPFQLSIYARAGYDDDVTTSNLDKQGSGYTNGGATLSYDFGDARTQLTLAVGAGFTYYWEHIRSVGIDNNDYDINATVSLSLKHKASARLTLSTIDYITYQTEPDFTLAQGLNRRGGNYFYTNDKFTADYLWAPRFSTATSYTLVALKYDDSAVGVFSDRVENTFGNEFRFLVWPTTSLVAEYRFQFVIYDNDIGRDSTTHFALAGVDHAFTTRLTASLRGGAEFRTYDQFNGDRTSPYFEGTLNYAVAKQTNISWSNRYSIEESDVPVNPNRKTFRTGLSAKHDFTPRITGNLGVYYEHDDYQGANIFNPEFTEESIDLAISARYGITRYFGVEAGYNHTEVTSDLAFREYSRNRYWAGLNVIF